MAIVAFLAVTVGFASCKKDNDDGTNVPGAVENFTATAGNGQVSLTWNAPSDDGGANITGYEVTRDDWTDKVEKTASQLSHSYTGLTNETEYTFIIRALNAKGKGAESTIKATPIDPLTYDEGIVIKGVTWATRNVDEPGKFTAKPEDAGMYYQWNSKVGWTAEGVPSNGTSTWNSDWNGNGADTWETVNCPCPAGWRIPSKEDFEKLVDAGGELVINPAGYRFGSGDNTVFFPAAGYLETNSSFEDVNVWGGCWSSTADGIDYVFCFGFDAVGDKINQMYLKSAYGISIRCVKE